FTSSGDHAVEVRLDDDALPVDNRRWLALPVKDEINVLLVNGRAAGRARETATHYLETALSPSTESRQWEGVTRPRVIAEGEFVRTDLSAYDTIILSDVGLMTDREAEILETYVESGGGLIITLGPQVNTQSYNRLLYRDGEGLLPARLGERVGDAESPNRAIGFETQGLDHPIVQQFAGNPGTGLESDFVLEYVRAELPKDSTARVALKYSTGDPAIIDAAVGRGRVILITTAADIAWGPWPMQRSFPPIIHETVRHAIAGRWGQRQRLIGEPLVRAFPTRAFSMSVTLTRPDGETESLTVQEGSGETTSRSPALKKKPGFFGVTVEQTHESGIYRLDLGPPLGREELFAVNVDPRESDLAKLSEDELKTELFADADAAYLTRWQNRSAAAETAASDSPAATHGLARWLLVAVLCLVFVEQLMAWRFGFGMGLLYVCVAAAFVWQAASWHPLAGLALAAAFAAGLVALVLLVLPAKSARTLPPLRSQI
ncbi:MAG: beta-galactosidase trimerization domain-containing protein, partial [Planctomycetaceae bacterium]